MVERDRQNSIEVHGREEGDFLNMAPEEFEQVVFPQLFHISDWAAVQAQSLHLKYFRWSLILLVLAASPALIQALCGYVIDSDQVALLENVSRVTALLAAMFFAGTLIANFLIRLRHYDRDWYQGRALAESIKSIVWKYMMGADPYAGDGGAESERRYLADVHEMLTTAPILGAQGGVAAANSPRLTPMMQRIRQAEFSQRRETYAKFRIDVERQWYSRKAELHASSENRMFNAVIFCQFTALFLAMVRVAWPKTPLHFGPMLAALAAAFVAWSQLRRLGELAIAYSVAARDLGFVSEQAAFIHNDASLARYVADAENAISREHTMWSARREVSIPNRGAKPAD